MKDRIFQWVAFVLMMLGISLFILSLILFALVPTIYHDEVFAFLLLGMGIGMAGMLIAEK